MKKTLILVLALFVAAPLIAQAYTMSWSPVTTYDDSTAINAAAVGGIYYNVEMDGTQVATRISETSWVLPAVAKKSTHTFRAQTILGTGEVSEWSPPFSWTSPAGNPAASGQLKVVQ